MFLHIIQFIKLFTEENGWGYVKGEVIEIEEEIMYLSNLKGIYQVVKHLYPGVDDNVLSGELLESDRKVFDRYGLR